MPGHSLNLLLFIVRIQRQGFFNRIYIITIHLSGNRLKLLYHSDSQMVLLELVVAALIVVIHRSVLWAWLESLP